MHSAIIRLGGRGADQQSLEGLVSAELFEQKTDVIDQVKIVRKMGSNVVQICSGTLELPGSNRFENGHKGRLCGSEAPGVFGRPWHPTVGVLHGWSGLDDGSSLLHGIEVGQFRWRDVLRWSHLGAGEGTSSGSSMASKSGSSGNGSVWPVRSSSRSCGTLGECNPPMFIGTGSAMSSIGS